MDRGVGRGGEEGMNGLRDRGSSGVCPPGDLSIAALDPGAWYDKVCERGCRFTAALAREEKASDNWHSKKEAEKADKVEVALGVVVESMKRFKVALIELS